MAIQVTFQRDPSTGQVLFDANGYPQYGTNTGANTYSALQQRVQNEVLGSPQTSDIQNAIQDAIAAYERESFWFNQVRSFGGVTGSLSDLQTVAGKEFYSDADLPVLVNMPHISKISVLAFANRYPLNERTPQWIDDQSISTTWQGLPTDWCWQAGSLRLYPVPNGGYPLILDATIRFAPLVNSTDYSCWTNEAERLIRLEAKRLLFVDIIRDGEQAAVMEREINGDMNANKPGELSRLRRENLRRSSGPAKIRASRGYF